MGVAHAIDERLRQYPKEIVGFQLSPKAARDLSRLIKGYYQLEERIREKIKEENSGRESERWEKHCALERGNPTHIYEGIEFKVKLDIQAI